MNDAFHLTWLSPCINRGINDGAPELDFDGDARPYMGTVDIGYDEYVGTHPLEADVFSISAASGGTANFTLNAGPDNALRSYIILAGASGTVPGFHLPGGPLMFPMNWDVLTDLVLALVNSPALMNFKGSLFTAGEGTAVLNTLGPIPPTAVGITMHFAYLLYYPTYYPYDFKSNPLAIEILP